MRRKYLGDALDFWKGAMLEAVGHRAGLCVAAMITDKKAWNHEEAATYADLLGVPTGHIELRYFDCKSRQAYFQNLGKRNGRRDYFLDPDIGLDAGLAKKKMKKGKADAQHVTLGDVRQLLSDTNVVAVYQHSRHEKNWLNKSARLFRALHRVGCECTHVGMLFVTHSKERAREVHGALEHRLGAANWRVFILKVGARRRGRFPQARRSVL